MNLVRRCKPRLQCEMAGTHSRTHPFACLAFVCLVRLLSLILTHLGLSPSAPSQKFNAQRNNATEHGALLVD
jgi:hypothetical protein